MFINWLPFCLKIPSELGKREEQNSILRKLIGPSKAELWLFFYQHVNKMMRHKIISILGQVSFSSRCNGRFCQQYHLNENLLVSYIKLKVFLQALKVFILWLFIQRHAYKVSFQAVVIIIHTVFKPVIRCLWV